MRVLLCLFVVLSFSCSDENTGTAISCEPILIDESIFNINSFSRVQLLDYTLDGTCLSVSLTVGGCNGKTTIEMVSNGSIVESLPPQITFDFYDMNPQPCLALFTIEREFDLSSLFDLYKEDVFIINFRDNATSIAVMQ